MRRWWPGTESNCRHYDFQSYALPTELPGHVDGEKTCGKFPTIPSWTHPLPSADHGAQSIELARALTKSRGCRRDTGIKGGSCRSNADCVGVEARIGAIRAKREKPRLDERSQYFVATRAVDAAQALELL